MRILRCAAVAAVGSAVVVAIARAAADPPPTSACRFASPQEISAAAGVSVTNEIDRGVSGCTYNNRDNASGTEVSVDTFAAADFDRDPTHKSGSTEETDVFELGVEAKYLATQHQGVRSARLIVKADDVHAFIVEIFPTGDRAQEISVARLLLPRVQNS
jgi:hypothetical protein